MGNEQTMVMRCRKGKPVNKGYANGLCEEKSKQRYQYIKWSKDIHRDR